MSCSCPKRIVLCALLSAAAGCNNSSSPSVHDGATGDAALADGAAGDGVGSDGPGDGATGSKLSSCSFAGKPRELCSGSSHLQLRGSLYIGDLGKVALSWKAGQPPSFDGALQLFHPDGTASGGPHAVAWTSSMKEVLLWRGGHILRLQGNRSWRVHPTTGVVDAEGTVIVSEPFVYLDDAVMTQDGFVVAYKESMDQGPMQLVKLDAKGAPTGSPTGVPDGYHGRLVVDGTDLFLYHRRKDGIYLARYDSTLSSLAPPTLIDSRVSSSNMDNMSVMAAMKASSGEHVLAIDRSAWAYIYTFDPNTHKVSKSKPLSIANNLGPINFGFKGGRLSLVEVPGGYVVGWPMIKVTGVVGPPIVYFAAVDRELGQTIAPIHLDSNYVDQCHGNVKYVEVIRDGADLAVIFDANNGDAYNRRSIYYQRIKCSYAP